MINKTLVYERLSFICDALKRLESYSRIEPGQFPGSDQAAAAESYLRRALEAMFDIGRHLLSKLGETDLAAEYKSIASGLQKRQIVTAELGAKLFEMAGYRNRLVHFYHHVTDEELYQILQHDLDDIRQFISEVKAFMAANGC
ncbi:MAG: DUF86 domain-containing protein [Syntrophothermus sp.]|uniref:type VII toxin-antitoxin system HepT family RNase toxin n=1 Tax=Syntrophothermus sp. TaxID=2736299 RepID=UPI00257E6A07|nr:DUF86 domain-containing protein [Syntrophothermus sp.]NSW83243.1 DUF86 domain-containing protein [Syntrophothermus sp.]